MEQTADQSFQLALRHLERVRDAWWEPDWADLSLYGFYCLEACVVAAALHVGWQRPTGHQRKETTARRLTTMYGLPEIAELLVDLNAMRKFQAYGDIAPPLNLDVEDVTRKIERYVDSVRNLITL